MCEYVWGRIVTRDILDYVSECQYTHHRKHYKEYLVCKINEAGIDPGEFMTVEEIRPVLMREDKEVPNKQPNETDQAYLQRLKEVRVMKSSKDQPCVLYRDSLWTYSTSLIPCST